MTIHAGGKGWAEFLKLLFKEGVKHDPRLEEDRILFKSTLKKNHLLDAANIMRNKLGLGGFGVTIKTVFRNLDLKPKPSHHCLTALNWRSIVTTNFDLLLEQTVTDASFVSKTYLDPDASRIINDEGSPKLLLKLHGDLHNTDNIVLSREDYAKFKNGPAEPAGVQCLNNLLQRGPCLFLGCGHRDSDVSDYIDKVALSGTTGIVGYAVVDPTGADLINTEKMLEERRITPIRLEHNQIEPWLYRLAEMSEHRSNRLVRILEDQRNAMENQQMGLMIEELKAATKDVLMEKVAEMTLDSILQTLRSNLLLKGWTDSELQKLGCCICSQHHELLKKAILNASKEPGEYASAAAKILKGLSFQALLEAVKRDRSLAEGVLTEELTKAI